MSGPNASSKQSFSTWASLGYYNSTKSIFPLAVLKVEPRLCLWRKTITKCIPQPQPPYPFSFSDSYYSTQAGIKLKILLPGPLEFWGN